MSMNKYFKEIDYIETFLSKRKLDTGFKSNLKLLAKYYRYKDKLDKIHKINNEEDLEKMLYVFCDKKCSDWFNKVLHYRMIDNAVKYAFDEKNVVIHIEKVPITKTEVEYIKGLGDEFGYLEKKILFTMLVINKANNIKNNIRGYDSNYYFSGGDYGYKQLMDCLGEKLTRTFKQKGIHETIKKFNDKGLTRTTNKLSLELLYLKEIEFISDIEIEVLDFDDIGLYWDYLDENSDKKITKCEKCNKIIHMTNGNKKCCKDCAQKVLQEKKNIWKKEKWKKS